jgi:hypothetical protein
VRQVRRLLGDDGRVDGELLGIGALSTGLENAENRIADR